MNIYLGIGIWHDLNFSRKPLTRFIWVDFAFTPGVAGGYSPKALRALYNALSTNFACIGKNIRTTGLAYFHIVMFSLRIQGIWHDLNFSRKPLTRFIWVDFAFTPGVARGYSPKALRALYNALSTNFACIEKNIRTTGLAYFHIVMFSLRIQDYSQKYNSLAGGTPASPGIVTLLTLWRAGRPHPQV